jgi:uncharacterized membrane protein YcaP (DUF421 family)
VDLLQIPVRVVFAYVVLLVLMRLSGKRSVRQASPFDFTFAIAMGDLIDNMMLGEVRAAVFVVATGVLMATHVALDQARARAVR